MSDSYRQILRDLFAAGTFQTLRAAVGKVPQIGWTVPFEQRMDALDSQQPADLEQLRKAAKAFNGQTPLIASVSEDVCHLVDAEANQIADFTTLRMSPKSDDARCRAVAKIVNAMPSLLDEVEALRREVERLESVVFRNANGGQ